MKHYDAIIIGAGAAGLMCAAIAGKRQRKVLLIDHAKKVGEKIRISGGGRCNFTNIHTSPKNFISQNPYFCVSALQRFTPQDFIELVKKHKIAFHEKTLGQLFCDFSSQQIIDMLLKECEEGSVEILLEHIAKSIKKIEDLEMEPQMRVRSKRILAEESRDNISADSKINFTLKIENKNTDDNLSEQVFCESLIIATGGLSIPKMGASSFGYDMARKFGIKIIEPYPALVPLTLEKSMLDDTRNLAGVSVEAIVSCAVRPAISSSAASLANAAIFDKPLAASANKHSTLQNISFREAILFTHRGLSGPAILQISSYLQRGQELTINMAPDHNIYDIFLAEKKLKPKQEIATILNKYIPKSLAAYIVQTHLAQGWIADMPSHKLKEIANHVNAWKLQPEGTEGYVKAEVTAGGIDTNEISSKTFECKSVPNLYFIGEVLDVTGHLGGFNFQFAWSCGHAAGQFI